MATAPATAAKPAKKKTKKTAPTSKVFAAQPQPPDPRRYREFTVSVGRETLLSESGIETDLDAIIAGRRKAIVEAWKANQSGPYDNRLHWSTFASNWGDEVVWEGPDVAAVLLPYFGDNTYEKPEMRVFRFDTQGGRLSRGREEIDPSSFDSKLDNQPVELEEHRGTGKGPVATFRVVNELARLNAVHQGPGLTLEDVVAEYSQHFDAEQEDGPSDYTFYQGHVVVAVVRNFGDGSGKYRVYDLVNILEHEDTMQDEAAEFNAEMEERSQQLHAEAAKPVVEIDREEDEPEEEALNVEVAVHTYRAHFLRNEADLWVSTREMLAEMAGDLARVEPDYETADEATIDAAQAKTQVLNKVENEALRTVTAASTRLAKAVLAAHGLTDGEWWEPCAIQTESCNPKFLVMIAPGVDGNGHICFDANLAEVICCNLEQVEAL
jgi:hypothetical protein